MPRWCLRNPLGEGASAGYAQETIGKLDRIRPSAARAPQLQSRLEKPVAIASSVCRSVIAEWCQTIVKERRREHQVKNAIKALLEIGIIESGIKHVKVVQANKRKETAAESPDIAPLENEVDRL